MCLIQQEMWKISKYQASFFALSLTTIVSLVADVVYAEENKCEAVAAQGAWRDQNTVVDTGLKSLAGTWISEGCETRPGPEYLLRSYTFNSDGIYQLIQHHYWDDSCSSPKWTIVSHGKIQLRTSISQPESATGVVRPVNVSVIPQDDNAIRELDLLASRNCPGQYWKSWKRHEEHLVANNRQEHRPRFNLWLHQAPPTAHHQPPSSPGTKSSDRIADLSCLGPLRYTFNELKLIKIQFRPVLPIRKHPKHMEMELLLGDIHSNKKRREYYTPSSFQAPLLRQTKGENVTVQRKHHFTLKKSQNVVQTHLVSNPLLPPHLIEKPHLPPYIWGEWVSSRCETRPLDVYLLRRFSFDEEQGTWRGEHKFFSDPFCAYPKFIVVASGRYVLQGQNAEMKETSNIDFFIERATLTALEQSVITDMRLLGFCGIGEWKVNIPKELGTTGGCIPLGIVLPSFRYDIAKVEVDYNGSWLLFLGQAETNSLALSDNERPTAFQLPMVKCGEVARHEQSLQTMLESWRFFRSSAYTKQSCVFLHVAILFIATVLR